MLLVYLAIGSYIFILKAKPIRIIWQSQNFGRKMRALRIQYQATINLSALMRMVGMKPILVLNGGAKNLLYPFIIPFRSTSGYGMNPTTDTLFMHGGKYRGELAAQVWGVKVIIMAKQLTTRTLIR